MASRPKTPPPPVIAAPTPPPTVEDAAKAQQDSADDVNRKRGRASTILTSAQGDASTPTLGAKTLLGY